MDFTAKQIAEVIQGTVEGDENVTIHTFSKIEEGAPGAISFLANPKYSHFLYSTKSSIVLVNKDFQPEQPVQATLIRVDDAYASIARLLTFYESTKPRLTGISPLASIAENAKIGNNCYIAPFAYIGDHAVVGNNVQLYPHVTVCAGAAVGDDTTLYPSVTVYHNCRIGNRCILHAGAVIGADGFGFAPTAQGYEKIPQIGIVTIEDDVEIGANTCVDRSTMGSTYVRRGVKLDNLVQIAHNTDIGQNTVMSSQVGVAGSTKIGQWCMFGGQVGVAGHVNIGDHVIAAGQTGISGDPRTTRGNVTIMGSPGFDAKDYMRSNAVFKSLPQFYRDFYAMKKELEELKATIDKK